MSRPPPDLEASPSVPGLVADYQATVGMLYAWANVLAHVDLPGLLRDIARAEAVGPIVDPTLYREKGKALREDRAILEAASRLRDIGIRLQDRAAPERTH